MTDPIRCGPRPKLRKTARFATRNLTRGERVVRFIETHCIVPDGVFVGRPVQLDDFQKLFILAVYDNPHETDTAILSIARKNAKTATIAFLVITHLVGPEARLNSEIVSGAMSRAQAAQVYKLAAKCIALSPTLRDLVRVVPSQKMLVGLPMNVEYQAISAEASTAHGGSPVLAIIDEAGQVRGPRSDFIDAVTTSQGAHASPLLIYISTQAPTDADFLSIAIDDATTKRPKKTVCHVYEAPREASLLDVAAWHAANPALATFRSMADMEKQAQKAARMPSFENTFRNLNLNQRVSTFSPFVSRGVWMLGDRKPGSLDGMTVHAGLDLSARTDLTSLVVVGDVAGMLQAWAYFWTPEEGLRDRSDRDRQPYDVWVREGWLRTTPGKTVDYEFVVAEIAEILAGMHCEAIAFDRWRIDVLRKECERAGIDLPLVEFGQGFKDMAPAVDSLEELLLNGRIAHGGHPVLTMCAAHAAVTRDPAGNRKLDKAKATGRIDGMVALAMAIGARGKTAEPTDGDLSDFLRSPILG